MLETMDKDHSGAVEFEEFLQVRLQSLASTCGLPLENSPSATASGASPLTACRLLFTSQALTGPQPTQSAPQPPTAAAFLPSQSAGDRGAEGAAGGAQRRGRHSGCICGTGRPGAPGVGDISRGTCAAGSAGLAVAKSSVGPGRHHGNGVTGDSAAGTVANPLLPTGHPSCLPPLPPLNHSQPDKGGQVSVERLARTLAAFDLRIDLDRLLVRGGP